MASNAADYCSIGSVFIKLIDLYKENALAEGQEVYWQSLSTKGTLAVRLHRF